MRLEFTGNKNDTLAIADEAAVRSIIIGSDTFFYDHKICLQSKGGSNKAKLAEHTVIRLANTKRTGAYNTSAEVPGVTYYSSINPGTEIIHLKNPAEEMYKKVNTFYIGDKYNHFIPLTKGTC